MAKYYCPACQKLVDDAETEHPATGYDDHIHQNGCGCAVWSISLWNATHPDKKITEE